jgi:hypothetical protein
MCTTSCNFLQACGQGQGVYLIFVVHGNIRVAAPIHGFLTSIDTSINQPARPAILQMIFISSFKDSSVRLDGGVRYTCAKIQKKFLEKQQQQAEQRAADIEQLTKKTEDIKDFVHCSDCNVLKDVSVFLRNPSFGRDGGLCKSCTECGKKYRERDAKKKREKRSRQGHRKQNYRDDYWSTWVHR